MGLKSFERNGNQIVLHIEVPLCSNTWEFVDSGMFGTMVGLYLDALEEEGSPLLEALEIAPGDQVQRQRLVSLLRALVAVPLEKALPDLGYPESYLAHRDHLSELVERLYDYWRGFDRFVLCHSVGGPRDRSQQPYRTFNATVEQLTHLVRAAYRDIAENITGDHPRVYRQVHAGCNVGLIAVAKDWQGDAKYAGALGNIPFIRQVLIYPPMIIDPPMNKRSGEFRKVDENPLDGLSLEEGKWTCYPAKVGPLTIFVYFHHDFMGLGCSLANLFELASDPEIAAGPDAIYLYGVAPEGLAKYGEQSGVFCEQPGGGPLVAAVSREERFGYFGYLKKMILTLHNVAMMRRGLMPFHGAMSRITANGDGKAKTLVLLGDTGTGKSETLEALRLMSGARIRELRVIADDMGSLEVRPDGALAGYGTEIGAFIRLDDLQRGYAFGQIDRAIIMSPQKVNARVVLPVTTLSDVLRGYTINFLLYANNYEHVDAHHPIIERFRDVESALKVFREGAAMSKGTTTSTGLVHSYFANIFGPAQYEDLHEALALKTFQAAFDSGVYVGQMRTRLGIPGLEATGPQEAARALLDVLAEHGEVE